MGKKLEKWGNKKNQIKMYSLLKDFIRFIFKPLATSIVSFTSMLHQHFN